MSESVNEPGKRARAVLPPVKPADSRDWIVAPATPSGHGAIAVVRLDGPGCWEAAARVWRPLEAAGAAGAPEILSAAPSPPEPRRLTLGEVVERGMRNAECGEEESGDRIQNSESRIQESGDRIQNLESRSQNSEFRIQNSEVESEEGRELQTANRKLQTENSKLQTANCKPETRNPKPETRNPNPETLDQVLLAWFPTPHSYTGNDLVEFHCHGSPSVVRALVESLMAAGARMARPGEFTERAFFNGRLDLAQAEGVANLVAARTRAAGRAALLQLRGVLSREVSAIRESLLDLAAEIEARLDFPEEEIEPSDREKLEGVFHGAHKRLERLRATARRGKLLRDGARVAIVGKPNVGKSSLFNELVGMERAIVTPHPGTTRDTIEATVEVRGMPVTLVDTAGVTQNTPELIERLGIERTMREIRSADLALFVLDGGAAPDEEDFAIYASLGGPYLLIVNKSDLPPATDDARFAERFPNAARLFRVSALRGEGLEPLEAAIAEEILGRPAAQELLGRPAEQAAEAEGATVTNLRHAECLNAASEALERARRAFARAESGELVMVDLYEALDKLGEILGLSVDDAVLSRIFSRFCIGK